MYMALQAALCFLCLIFCTRAARILVSPYDVGYSSRLMDYSKLTSLLIEDGHSISLLINEDDKQFFESVKGIEHFYLYPTPVDLRDYATEQFRKVVLKPGMAGMQEQLNDILKLMSSYCRSMLSQKQLLQNIKKQKFDLFFVDFAQNCGRILKYWLNIPSVAYSSTGPIGDPSFFPTLPSIMPAIHMGYTDRMDFKQRSLNALMHWMSLINNPWTGTFDDIAKEFDLDIPRVEEAFVDSIVFAICDPSLDYAKPLFQNIRCVGGLNNRQAKPLGADLEEFVQSAGPEGVVLVSFGSVLSRIDSEDKAGVIGRALARLPYKVIWRFSGERPRFVGENTRIEQWIPQNDLLGHSQIKAFVTHCGSHGTFEAAFHGVPVVAVPVYIDQFYNAKRLVDRASMGIEVPFESLNEDQLYNAIIDVMTNATYKQNAMHTSHLLLDRPITAQQEFLFYIDYSIRNNGSGKLGANIVKDLSSFYLFSVDIIVTFVGIIVSLSIALLWCCVKLIKCCITNKSKNKKD